MCSTKPAHNAAKQDVAQRSINLAVMKAVRLLSSGRCCRITFGQIYMQLVRCVPDIPTITQCVMAVDVLVTEGLLVSEKVFEEDPAFPYPLHLISGLTDVGAASLEVNG